MTGAGLGRIGRDAGRASAATAAARATSWRSIAASIDLLDEARSALHRAAALADPVLIAEELRDCAAGDSTGSAGRAGVEDLLDALVRALLPRASRRSFHVKHPPSLNAERARACMGAAMFDVLVIGGGHAGCEAACAAARRGARVALADLPRRRSRPDVVQPVDRRRRQGPSGPRSRRVRRDHGARRRSCRDPPPDAQCAARAARSADRASRPIARSTARRLAELVAEAGVEVIEGEAVALRLERRAQCTGVELADGTRCRSRAVVLATGHLPRRDDVSRRGAMDRGPSGRPGGRALWPRRFANSAWPRAGSRPARRRGSTGERSTGRGPCRSRATATPGRWRWRPILAPQPQLACAITRTNERSHDVIRAGLGRSPLFAGAIEGRGPRYCPSIEDKVHRFGDRDGHQIFLEPEGLDTHLVYPNGISTSLPTDVQLDFVRSIEGLERAEIVQPGYAVEYEYADPRRLEPTLAASRRRRACSSPVRSTARPATRKRPRRDWSPASMPPRVRSGSGRGPLRPRDTATSV